MTGTRAVVVGVVVTNTKIPAIYVINKTIAIIINAITGNFTRINPKPTSQVRMRKINARIDMPDDNAVTCITELIPDPGSVDVVDIPGNIRAASLLACGRSRPPGGRAG